MSKSPVLPDPALPDVTLPELATFPELAALPEAARPSHRLMPSWQRSFLQREKAIRDPTSLILVDEAERLKMVSLEAMCDIFDRGGIGLILIGMRGIEKRLAHYPQLYSRIGFVHEFRPLSVAEVRRLLDER